MTHRHTTVCSNKTYGFKFPLKTIAVALQKLSEKTFEIPEAEAFRLEEGVTFNSRGKKILDMSVASLALVPAVIIMSVIAVLVRCDSKGPVFFCQKRLGKDGKPFNIIKFRTMHHKACDAFGGEQATHKDKRVTRLGRYLRRSSFDELPQLLHVLRGEMSLIGPRPHAVAHDMYFSQHVTSYWQRYAIKPGLTGWAQINGLRGETAQIETMQARVDHDMDYIHRRTLVMDIKILFKTLWIMVKPPKTLH